MEAMDVWYFRIVMMAKYDPGQSLSHFARKKRKMVSYRLLSSFRQMIGGFSSWRWFQRNSVEEKEILVQPVNVTPSGQDSSHQPYDRRMGEN